MFLISWFRFLKDLNSLNLLPDRQKGLHGMRRHQESKRPVDLRRMPQVRVAAQLYDVAPSPAFRSRWNPGLRRMLSRTCGATHRRTDAGAPPGIQEAAAPPRNSGGSPERDRRNGPRSQPPTAASRSRRTEPRLPTNGHKHKKIPAQ